jgi:hypothetical protein
MIRTTFVLRCVNCKRRCEIAGEKIDPEMGPDPCPSCFGVVIVESIKVMVK